MKKDLNVSINLNSFTYHNQEFDWTTEMPNYWFSFFKIDGSNCILNDDLQLKGIATIHSSFKKIESLRNLEPNQQDILPISHDFGRKEIKLNPISTPDFIKKTNILNIESYSGCIAVLMNDECVANDEKNKYTSILNQTIQNSLNNLIPLLIGNQSQIDAHLNNLKNEIELNINNESRKHQSFWRRFTSENIIETTIWAFSSEELKSLQSVSLTKYWGTEGIWELSGKIKIKEKNINSIKKSELNPRKKQKVSIF